MIAAAPVVRLPWFALGCMALLAALVSPLENAAHDLFSAHMAQHLVLVYVAAPLFVAAFPGVTLPRALTSVVVVWSLHIAALWAWHLPSLYTVALYENAVHVLEHTSFLGTAILFWYAVASPNAARLDAPRALLLVFITAVAGGALGAVLTLTPTPLYEIHRAGTEAWGLTLLEDQQLAGLVMWVPAGVVYLGTACALFVGWMRRLEREMPRIGTK